MTTLVNKTYDEIQIGDSTTYTKQVTDDVVKAFASISGDVNPVHLDDEFAKTSMFGERIAHGMIAGSFVSAALANQLPGPGTIYANQSISFRKPVMIGDTLTVKLEVTEKQDKRQFVTLNCSVTNQDDVEVAKGEALVVAPSDKISVEAPPTPVIEVK